MNFDKEIRKLKREYMTSCWQMQPEVLDSPEVVKEKQEKFKQVERNFLQTMQELRMLEQEQERKEG